MSDLPPLRDVIARHGLRANKALGQNFLLDSQLLDRIAAIPGNLNGETVYEVGPGPGGLTRALLNRGANVIAVERDRRCISALEELSDHHPDKLKIIEGDALDIDERKAGADNAHIVANLPYNIGSALLIRWLTVDQWPPWWKSLTLMFQKEVAERIVAQPGTSTYGRLSIVSQWRANANLVLNVHRSSFVPPPKVMSAVVHIRPKIMPDGIHQATIERITKVAFGQRRKMLRQSIKSLPQAVEVLVKLKIDPTRRAETLTVTDYVNIARELGKLTD